jgi:two-component system, OmpR family, response regulator
MRVMLLEDDELLGDGLRDYLCAEGHNVHWCQTLGEARLASREPFDVWLVDWQLPDGSGVDWLGAQRARGNTTVALVLTARGATEHRIQGLDSGADDYLTKPVSPEEIAARLRAVARRQVMATAGLHTHDDVKVDCAARTVSKGREPVEVTAREWAILEALVLRRGRMLTKSEIESLIATDEGTPSSNVIEVHVSALRKKLGKDCIVTVRGLGYRWEGT